MEVDFFMQYKAITQPSHNLWDTIYLSLQLSMKLQPGPNDLSHLKQAWEVYQVYWGVHCARVGFEIFKISAFIDEQCMDSYVSTLWLMSDVWNCAKSTTMKPHLSGPHLSAMFTYPDRFSGTNSYF